MQNAKVVDLSRYSSGWIRFRKPDGSLDFRDLGLKLPYGAIPIQLNVKIIQRELWDPNEFRHDIGSHDIVVYTTKELEDPTAEVLSSRWRPLPAGSTVLAVYVNSTNEVFALPGILSRDEVARTNLANRIEMALGTRGVLA